MTDASLLDEVFELLTLATQLEEKKDGRIEAATKYYEAVYLMRRSLQKIPSTPAEVATRQLLQEKVGHYETLASQLMADDTSSAFNPRSPVDNKVTFFNNGGTDNNDSCTVSVLSLPPPPATACSPRSTPSAFINTTASQANARLVQALDLDEANETVQAIAVYMQACELYLKAIRAVDENSSGNSGSASQSQQVGLVMKRRLENTLDRVEQLKSLKNKAVVPQPRIGEQKQPPTAAAAAATPSSSLLTSEEISVLKQSSMIASGLFLPWSDQDVVAVSKAALQPKGLFTDPDGLLPLSDKQKQRFHRWARPSEIVKIRQQSGFTRTQQTLLLVKAITPYTIKQQYITDCSFIASLCICAAFERRFRKRLITSILYPQTPQGALLYNPEGKYLVKLWLNGVARCVVIDDMLPVDKHGNLLCSQTTGPRDKHLELWVCLIEKAYMKLCGGYDFPGSNSGVDLFSLTGWIPERILFAKNQANVKDFETHPERAWERISSAISFGDCLITVSTTHGVDEREVETDIGLVTGHAYAVLSVVETKNGTRLLQLKNPWAHKGWKGRYSSSDTASWNDAGLCAEVGYNPELAAKHDDGIFWICWADILVYFQNFHLSWNPALFKFRATMHGCWPSGRGPMDDSFNVGDNPQYVISLSEAAVLQKATVWILISRHVTKQEQEGSDVLDFLTVHIHRNNGKKERIWYPGQSGNCVLTGAYTNNPHVLVRYDVSGPADRHLSLVLSQYKKSNDLSYTLSCFSTEQFSLGLPTKDFDHSLEFPAAWTSSTAGGPIGSANFTANPAFAVKIPDGGSIVQLRVSTKRTMAVNVVLVQVDSFRQRVDHAKGSPVIDTDKYKHGFLVSTRTKVEAGSYVAVVSTFHPGQTAPFLLRVCSSRKVMVEAI